jgi:hypothetical protein
MKFTAIILIGLALLGGGCATSSPTASKESPRLHELDTAQDAGAESGPLWSVIYWVAYYGGQALASR